MIDAVSRRDFLRTTSAAGLAAAVTPVPSVAGTTGKSRVVIATDTTAVSSTGSVVAAKIQPMVDAVVMALTGKTSLAAAYAGLFPTPPTSSTKVLLKRNDISGSGAVNTAVVNALKAGLGNIAAMPASNVTIRCQGGSARSQLDAANYVINCPVCWCHGTDYGVTLSLKNTMTYLNDAGVYHSADKAWLHNVSLDPAVRPKQVLSFMDALVGNNQSGPGSSPTFRAGVIIASKDIVAVDYQALRVMAAQSGASTSRIATGDAQLRAAESAGLGTCTVANMEIIRISPPWTTGIIEETSAFARPLPLEVSRRGDAVEFGIAALPDRSASVTVYDALGNAVWSRDNVTGDRVVWNSCTQSGLPVSPGMYTYAVTAGRARARGVLLVY